MWQLLVILLAVCFSPDMGESGQSVGGEEIGTRQGRDRPFFVHTTILRSLSLGAHSLAFSTLIHHNRTAKRS